MGLLKMIPRDNHEKQSGETVDFITMVAQPNQLNRGYMRTRAKNHSANQRMGCM